MTKREKERKIKMFGMIGMSVLVIASLATSTYAWYVSRNKATVNTTNLTVADVYSDYIVYSYTENDGAHGYGSPLSSYDFSEHFAPLEKGTLLSATALFPGRNLTYCLELTPITNSTASTFTFQIQNYTASATVQARIGDAVQTVSMAYAIEIRAAAYTCLDTELDAKEQDFFTSPLDDQFNHGANAITNIVSGEFDSTKKSYIFFTITFSNDPGTYFSASEGTLGEIDYTYVKDVNGNSNVYENMDFAITAIHVEVA